MFKRLSFICGGILVAGLLVFPVAVQAQAAWKWPETIIIGTPAVGTATHASAASWGAILEKATGARVRIIPEGSEAARMRRLLAGEMNIATITKSEQTAFLEGEEGYVALPKGDFRMIWHHADTPWGWAVRGDSFLKSIYDIRKQVEAGKPVRVAVNTAAAVMMIWVEQVLPSFLGILDRPELMKNIVYVPFGSYVASVRSLAEGRADVAMVATTSAVTFEVEAHPQGLRWLDKPVADKKGWAEVLRIRPLTFPAKIGIGVKSARGRAGWMSNFILTGTVATDPELVYQLSRWFHQNFEAYRGAHDINHRMSVEIFREILDFACLPVHEGAIRYLKEIGKWTPADDTWNAEAIKLVARYNDAWKLASARAAEKNIRIAHDSKEWVSLWESAIKDIPRFRVRLN